MFAVITPEKIQLPPGAVVQLPGSWQDYQKLTQQLGDRFHLSHRQRLRSPVS